MAMIKALTPSASPNLRFLKTRIANPPAVNASAGQAKSIRSICTMPSIPRAINVDPVANLIHRSPGRILPIQIESFWAIKSPSAGIDGKIYPGNFDLERVKNTIGNTAQQAKKSLDEFSPLSGPGRSFAVTTRRAALTAHGSKASRITGI